MLRKIYHQLKKIPFLNRLLDNIRLAVYRWVVHICQETMQPIEQKLEQKLEQNLNEHIKQQTDKTKNISERLEYVRLELFFELMHRLEQNPEITETSNNKAVIHNTAAFKQAQKDDRIRLNLGCGHLPLADYLNVDQRALPQVDIQANILNLPVKKDSVDTLYAAHLIEHFTLENLRRNILPYWRDVLKPNGKLHLIAPNAHAMIIEYAKEAMDFKQLSTVLMGMQEYDGDFHYALLTPESLKKLLEEAGFQSVEFVVEARKNGLCFEMELIARKPQLS
jgi:predicted SAM-dependent methyltransferase